MSSFVTGSVSRYCLQNSPVPCIVVRPNKKRLAKKAKRLADERRRNYQGVLNLSGARGSTQVLQDNKNEMECIAGTAGGASEKEALAVAAAIGIPRSLSRLEGLRRPTPSPDDEGAPLARTLSGKSDYTTSVGDSPSPTGAYVVSGENSPELEPLDSPAMTDEDVVDSEVEGKSEDVVEPVRGRGRTMSHGEEGKTTGAKRFVFPEKRRKSLSG